MMDALELYLLGALYFSVLLESPFFDTSELR